MPEIIKVDYAVLERAAERIGTLRGMLNDNLDELQARLNGLVWEGSDSEAYIAHQQQWDTSVRNLNQLLVQIAKEIDNAKVRFIENETRGVRRWAV